MAPTLQRPSRRTTMPDPVALGQPTVGEAELAAVARVFASGLAVGGRADLRGVRAAVRQVCGVAHALATSSCGSALHLALLALGAGPGDEVVVADYTFPATGHAVLWTGADARSSPTCGRTSGASTRQAVEAAVTAADRRHPGGRPVRAAGRLRRAAGGRRPARAVPGRGRRLRRGGVVPGATRRQPGRRRLLQLPRPQGDHRGRGRRADHRRRRVVAHAPASCTATASQRRRPRAGTAPTCRCRRSTSSARTTGSPTSPAAIMLAQLDRLPTLRRRAPARWPRAYAELLAGLEQVAAAA